MAAFTPIVLSNATMVRTSFRSGMLDTRTGSAVSSAAARIGSAAFFAPATRTSPASGVPPWMESFCMSRHAPPGAVLMSARRPLFRGEGLHRQRVDLFLHAIAERGVDE